MQLLNRMIIVATIALTISGCAHFVGSQQRGTASNLLAYLYPNGEAVDHSKDVIPHLQLPIKVGLAFVPEQDNHYVDYDIPQTQKQKLLEQVAKQFKDQAYIDEITVIPEIYMRQGKGFNALERIAALHQVDVMALVSFDQVVASRDNELSLTYLTIVGAYIFPGNTHTASTFVDTAVFDVKTRRLLFRAPGYSERKQHSTGIGFEASREKLAQQDFAEAMQHMQKNLQTELKRFEQRASNGEGVKISHRAGYGGGSMGLWGIVILVLLLRFVRNSKP